MTDCPKCKGKLQIKRAYNKAFNDNTPTAQTKVYTIQEIACMNDKCEMFNIVVDEKKHKLELEV